MSELTENREDASNQPAAPPSDVVRSQSEVVSLTEEAWLGPLPHPDAYQRYEEIEPGAANRILTMAENEQRQNHEALNREQEHNHKVTLNEQQHNHEMTRRVIAGNDRRSYLGIGLAFIIAMSGIGCGTFLSAIGREGIGAAFVVTPLVGLVGVFIYGTQSRRAERSRRSSRSE